MYQVSKELNVKHSNPFSCICKYINDDGSPIDLKDHTIKVDIKNGKEAFSGTATNGAQYFIPFTALEDAKINALEIQCNTAQANATVSLGIYASNTNNDVADPLFTSDPISCSTAGAKNAPCNVQIVKGKVYWLSSLSIGTPNFQRIGADTLFSFKGSTTANTTSPNGYYTINNTSMAQSAPTSKMDNGVAPRVMFITG